MQTFRADIGAANDNRHKKRSRVLWSVFAVFIILSTTVYFQSKHYLFEGLPQLPDKQAMWELNVQPNITLLDKDGNIIGHRGPYYGRPLQLAEMPAHLVDAFLAIEDQRFYQHPGIDRKAIIRAVLENTKAGKKVQGGSTLTQQLIKNMVLSPEKTYKRKFQEMWLAYKMEQLLTKPEILELYLNRIDLGNRAYGVEAAAQRYFAKSATEVSLSEAAVLAALPRAPSAYDPTRNPKSSQARSDLVLQTMMVQGKISPQELADAQKNPAQIVTNANLYLKGNNLGHVFDMVTGRAEKLIGSQTKDLIIRTTIDTKLQEHALSTINTVVSKAQKRGKVSEGALVSIETTSGAVRALIGGRNYGESKFNRATQALRQPGSSFKAFVYAAALEAGFTPGTVRVDQPIDIAGWKPQNYTHRYRGPVTIREALKLSINTVAAQVGAEIGPHKVVELARRFGITSKLGAHYAITLGTSEVTLIDMVSAFMVFANDGIKKPTYIIQSISDTAGKSLYVRQQNAAQRVYARPHAQQMTSILMDAVETGTGHGARLAGRDVAGKTGTTQDYRDAWFIGFTADYTTGVWLGNDDNSPMHKITGGMYPVDSWKMFMLKAHQGKPGRPLTTPNPQAPNSEAFVFTQFYQNLGNQFLSERNLANGVNTQSANRQQN